MLIALATLLFGSLVALAAVVIGHELREHGPEMMRALGLGAAQPRAAPSRQFRVIQRRRMAPVRLAERHPYRAAA